MEFDVRLREARQDKNLTQEKAAQELNVSRQTISSWENERSYLVDLVRFYYIQR